MSVCVSVCVSVYLYLCICCVCVCRGGQFMRVDHVGPVASVPLSVPAPPAEHPSRRRAAVGAPARDGRQHRARVRQRRLARAGLQVDARRRTGGRRARRLDGREERLLRTARVAPRHTHSTHRWLSLFTDYGYAVLREEQYRREYLLGNILLNSCHSSFSPFVIRPFVLTDAPSIIIQ